MKSPWIQSLRSVALTVPDLAAAELFYTQVWQLSLATRGDGVVYLRGSGDDDHLLALHAAPGTPTIRQVTLRVIGMRACLLKPPSCGRVTMSSELPTRRSSSITCWPS